MFSNLKSSYTLQPNYNHIGWSKPARIGPAQDLRCWLLKIQPMCLCPPKFDYRDKKVTCSCLIIILLQSHVRRTLPFRLYQTAKLFFGSSFYYSNTGPLMDGSPCWTSRENSLELIELSNRNKFSLRLYLFRNQR